MGGWEGQLPLEILEGGCDSILACETVGVGGGGGHNLAKVLETIGRVWTCEAESDTRVTDISMYTHSHD